MPTPADDRPNPLLVADAEPPPPTDGRSLRATRSRQLVVEAFLDLLMEGEVQPTAQQVSDRCGVSMRSIFRLFDDVEAMHAAAITTQVGRVRHLVVELGPDGPLGRRITAVVDANAALYEAIAPVRRMALRLAPTSRPIRTDLERSDAFFRSQVERVFAPELGALPAKRRRVAVELLDVATSFEVWNRLRTTQGLEVEAAAKVVQAMVEHAVA